MDPQFLHIDEVLAIHADQIERYGGDATVRDMGLLISAVNMPRASFGGVFAHADLFEMAAAYLFHIVQNHPFVDGNKRSGAVTAIMFLALNDVDVTGSNEQLHELVLDVAKGKTDKAAITWFFRENTSTIA